MASNISTEHPENIPLTDTPIGIGSGTILLPNVPFPNIPTVPQPTPRRSKPPGLPRDTILSEYTEYVNEVLDMYQKGGCDDEVVDKAGDLVKKMNRDLGYMQRKGARKKDISAVRNMRNELNSIIKSATSIDQLDSPVGLDSLYNDNPISVESSIHNYGGSIGDCQPTNQESLECRLQTLEVVVGEIKASEGIRTEKMHRLVNKLDRQSRIVEGLVERVRVQEEAKTKNTRSIEEYQQVPLDITCIKDDLSKFKKEFVRLEKSVMELGDTVSELSEENTKLKSKLASIGLARSRHSSELDQSSTEDNKEQLTYLEDAMWILIGAMEGTIDQSVDMSSDPMYIKDMYRNELPRLDKQASDIKADLNKYIKLAGHDVRVKDKIIGILKRAEKWKQELKRVWNKKEIFSVTQPSKDSMAEVGVFKGNAEINIFDFLRKFDSYLSGPTAQRVDRLFNNHLSEAIKNKVPHLSDDLVGLRQYLVDEYGKTDKMVNAIVNELESKKVPPTPTIKQQFTILTAISSTMTRLVNLKKHSEVDQDELDRFLSTNQFLSRIVKLLPDTHRMVFMRDIAAKGLDARHISGITAFEALATFARTSADAMEEMAKENDDDGKVKAVHSVCNHTSEVRSREEDQNINLKDPPTQPKANSKNSKSGQLVWGGENLRFPCPLSDHIHELRNCPAFFALTPKERRNMIPYERICKLCLRPRFKCEERLGNSCRESIPPIIRCWDCERKYKYRKTTPRFNVLYCFDPSHEKPSQTDLYNGLAAYLGPLSDAVRNKQIVVAACFNQPATVCANACMHSQCRSFHTTKTSPPCVDSVTPAIDTHTGLRVDIAKELIRQESPYDSFYLMQTIRLGSSTALIFYDKGSNCHLIDGALAEKEGLQVISDQPTSIRVAGSNTVVTEYGKYRFRIGPTREGVYHTLSCQGITEVTSEFSRYPMEDIVKECRNIPGLEDEIFPPYIGGGPVKLLIGIGDPLLEPERIFTLPTGLAIYRSAIKDIYGSYMCIGGPHPSFSNSKLKEANMVTTMLIREVDQFRQSIYGNSNIRLSYQGSESISPEIVYSLPVKDMKLTINPTPLNEEDFLDLGCSVQEEEGQYEVMHCGVYKAKVPISRLRELTEEKDLDDFPQYRCAKCTDCQDCKASSKMRSLTIREAAEQQLIEGSVEHCLDSKKMLVSLPFTKDPVQFLTEKHGGKDNYRQALKVYVSQCKKSEQVKIGMRKVHSELIQRGFMERLDDLSADRKEVILSSPFLHYYPWRTVYKEDSISTPVRMVVDPTMSHLNLILAKGTNSVANLLDILIRNRAAPYAWSSDISKLYNMLHLRDQALPYSLFLYHDSLDLSTPPEVWIMNRAWYGVTSTSGQAGHAIDMLVTRYGPDYPRAVEPLDKCRYVDDITPGSSSAEEREEQIKQCQELLDKGGFNLKFVVKSGEPPCEKASTDGTSMKLLGYKWIPQTDTLSPAR